MDWDFTAIPLRFRHDSNTSIAITAKMTAADTRDMKSEVKIEEHSKDAKDVKNPAQEAKDAAKEAKDDLDALEGLESEEKEFMKVCLGL